MQIQDRVLGLPCLLFEDYSADFTALFVGEFEVDALDCSAIYELVFGAEVGDFVSEFGWLDYASPCTLVELVHGFLYCYFY